MSARCALLVACGCVLSTLVHPCLAFALSSRAARNANVPQPISVTPAQDWEGIDGSWNTIPLRIGDPEQSTRALVSTASQQTWAIDPLACPPKGTRNVNVTALNIDKTCFDSRGRTFNYTDSDTWQKIGFYQLWLEQNLNMTGNGHYGYDTVGLGYTSGEGPTLKNTTVGTLISQDFWLGHFGINPKSTNFSAFNDSSPSYMTYLFQDKLIPSVSWGYTAGAQYRDNAILSSLTLGGYDASRFIPNDLTFGFAPDNERDIVVGVVGITADTTTKSNINLLERDVFTMYIDSTVAELYLPIEVCHAFEDAFGLTYDNATKLYLVDDLRHATLLAENASITFSLGQKFATNTTVEITLPYAALDKEAKPPYRGLNQSSRFFPIRRAEKETQFVLGRTFLQEAYLIVDWERQNFSVSQIDWTYGTSQDIVPILSPSITGEPYPWEGPSKHLSTGVIIGIAMGGGFTFAMVASAIAWWFWRKRHDEKRAAAKAAYASKTTPTGKESPSEKREGSRLPGKEDKGTNVFPKAELPADSERPTVDTDVKDADLSSPISFGVPSPMVEAENTERQIFEMEGDMPARQEAGGRQLSEKESMMVRERIYNGVDPHVPPDVSPATEAPPRRPAPLNASEVTLISRRLPSVSPTTPRTPRDGASLEANDTFFQPPPRAPRDGRYLEIEDTLLSPISPLESNFDTSRRRFSYES